jgi:hypothetical protein
LVSVIQIIGTLGMAVAVTAQWIANFVVSWAFRINRTNDI